MCTLKDDSFVVTGSNKTLAARKCQEYNAAENWWYGLPDLRQSRFDHSSCSFDRHLVFVFGGYSHSLRNHTNSIERLAVRKDKNWT